MISSRSSSTHGMDGPTAPNQHFQQLGGLSTRVTQEHWHAPASCPQGPSGWAARARLPYQRAQLRHNTRSEAGPASAGYGAGAPTCAPLPGPKPACLQVRATASMRPRRQRTPRPALSFTPGPVFRRLRRPRGKGHPRQGTAPGGRAATGRSPGTVPWRGALAVSWRLSRGSPALRHLRAAPHRRLWPKPSSVPGPNRPAQP